MPILVKRVYDEPSTDDGSRVLVDRLWPRGVSKEDAQLENWLREIAPSDGLREWFDHDPEKWGEFKRRYREELAGREDAIAELEVLAAAGTVTLLYATTDREHNNAVVLQEYLAERGDASRN